MTIKLFNLVSKKEQADLLEERAGYLCTRQEPEFIIDLYEMEDFFIEVYYHRTQEELVVVKTLCINEQPPSLADTLVPQLMVSWKNPFGFDANRGFA